MLRFALCPLVLFAIVMSCMGQTFQYSRGWTNGKRSSSHLHNNPSAAEVRLFSELQGSNRIFPFTRGHNRFKYPYLPHYNAIIDPVDNQYYLEEYYGAVPSVPSDGMVHHRSKEDGQDLVPPETHEFPVNQA